MYLRGQLVICEKGGGGGERVIQGCITSTLLFIFWFLIMHLLQTFKARDTIKTHHPNYTHIITMCMLPT